MTREWAWGAVLGVVVLSGCSSSGETGSNQGAFEACRGASTDSGAPVIPDGGEPEPSDAELAAIAEEECLAAGLQVEDCDSKRFITRGEAICIAVRLNVPEGTRPWRVGLVFASVTKVVIWNIGVATSPGNTEHYGIHAITGELVRRSTSTSTP